jgi:VWFA-related protein
MDANFHSCAVRLHLRMRLLLTAAFLCVLVIAGLAQEPCSITAERIQALRSGIETLKDPQPNPELRTEILEMRTAQATQARISNTSGSPAPAPADMAEIVKRAPERVCSILNKQPWPVKSVVGIDGAAAWISLLRSYLPYQTQLSLVPVISAGVDKKEIDKNEDLAFLIDRLRLRGGLAQLFGTQATEDKGFLVLYPLQSEEKVDQWRAEYKLPPLNDYIRALQLTYRKPLIRSTDKVARVTVPTDKSAKQSPAADLLAPGVDDNDVVKVQTSLVTIDATVYGDGRTPLDKKDFKVYENGQQQDITVFGAPESPFDIVLLLDLSGSTENQVGLIKKTTKRFVEMKRDVDRVAIVTFAGQQNLVSPLESDKAKLLDSIGKMKDGGDSRVWDAEKFALDMLNRDSSAGRRKAIVVMTDGADNALTYMPDFGSETLFADLVEEVRDSSVAIFPIFLDTQGPGSDSARVYADARRTLQLLASESGGNYYTADELSDLNEVYGRVLQDMGRVYSLGYEPRDARRDGTWRSIRVELQGHPEIKVRARPGYYAK